MLEMNELDSMCGISDDELTERFKEAIRIDNEIKKIKIKVNAKKHHKNRNDILQIRTKAAHTVIVNSKSTGTSRTECRTDGIK